MNILLEFTTLNYRIWHSMAVRLKEYYPQARFAGVVGISPEGKHALEFLKTQNDIHYEFLELRHNITEDSLKDEIDWDVIRDFEARLSDKSIWRIIAADRAWGSDYLHGVVMNRSYVSDHNDRDNILRMLSGTLKRSKKIFDAFEVDLFLPAICMGSVKVFIYEQLCRDRGIPYVVPTFTRINNIFTFASDVLLNYPHIDETYTRLTKGELTLDLSKAEEFYDQLTKEMENSRNFDRHLPGIQVIYLTSWKAKIKIFLRMCRAILGRIRAWHRQRRFNKSGDIRRQPYKLSVLWNNIANTIQFYRQKFVLLDPGFGEVLPDEQKYIYYPLHTSPEYSTNFQGTMWMNQLYNIEILSKSIPADWVVYVKEHPATLPGRTRPKNFFKEIMRYPNVRMAPVGLNSHRLVSRAEMVAVLTGTTGWEAVQRGVPVISFTTNNYDVLGLSRVCSNIERLAVDIREEKVRLQNISPEERKKRLVNYLAAMLEHSFEISHPDQFYYENGPVENCVTIGRETADALIKHLEYLQSKKEVVCA